MLDKYGACDQAAKYLDIMRGYFFIIFASFQHYKFLDDAMSQCLEPCVMCHGCCVQWIEHGQTFGTQLSDRVISQSSARPPLQAHRLPRCQSDLEAH